MLNEVRAIAPLCDGEEVTVTVPASDLADFKVMVREQIAGDMEELRLYRQGLQARAPRSDHLDAGRLERRLRLLWRIVDDVGGLY